MSDSAQPNQTNEQPKQEAQQEKTYAEKDVQRIVSELDNYKKRAMELENKFKNQELESAKANQEWQRVAQLHEESAKEYQSKFENFKKAVVSDKKLSAIREEAIRNGIRKESIADLGILDYPEVKLDADNEGNFLVDGADKAVQRLKTLRPHWFQSVAPKVHAESPSVTGAGNQVSWDDLKRLELDYKKNPNSVNAENYKKALLAFKAAGAK